MRYKMKHAVYEEINKCLESNKPSSVEHFVQLASDDFELALLLPFYMHYFHPYEWQNYSLFANHPLPITLNYAVYIALDAPALNVYPRLKRFFYGTALPLLFQTTKRQCLWKNGRCIYSGSIGSCIKNPHFWRIT